jgi:hypothetical protein
VSRFIVAAAILAALGFGIAGSAQAQIVYGYSTTGDDGGTPGVLRSPGYYYRGRTASNNVYLSDMYASDNYMSGGSYASGGSGYSPLSVYPTLYPPMGSNYRLSPVRMYGSSSMYSSSPYGMGAGFGGMNWMNSGYGGFNPMWMRRR